MKAFITGAEGALGTAVQNVLHHNGISFLATDIKQLDIVDYRKVNETLLKHRPDVILHFAAVSNVDSCEQSYLKRNAKSRDLVGQERTLLTWNTCWYGTRSLPWVL